MKHELYIRNKKDLSLKKVSIWKVILPFIVSAVLSLFIGVRYASSITILTNDGTYAISHENAFNEQLLKIMQKELS